MSLLYSQIRDELKTGDLLAWRITKINSIFDFILVLYQKILGARFSHVGIVVKLGGRTFVVEATPPAVRIFPLSMCDDFYLIKTNNLKFSTSYLNALFKHLGKKYSISDLSKGILDIKGDSSNLYCSELAKEFYKGIGYIDDEDAGLTPDKIVFTIQEKSGFEPVFVSIDRDNLVDI